MNERGRGIEWLHNASIGNSLKRVPTEDELHSQQLHHLSSNIPLLSISTPEHVTDIQSVSPSRRTSFPNHTWLPPLISTDEAMSVYKSPQLFDGSGGRSSSTSYDLPLSHLFLLLDFFLLFFFLFFLPYPLSPILSAVARSRLSTSYLRRHIWISTVGFIILLSESVISSAETLLSLGSWESTSPGRCIPRGPVKYSCPRVHITLLALHQE